MEDALVSKLIDIELEALEFDAPIFGYILDVERGEIWKATCGTNASKLWTGEFDRIFSVFGAIWKSFQSGAFNDLRAIRALISKRD